MWSSDGHEISRIAPWLFIPISMCAICGVFRIRNLTAPQGMAKVPSALRRLIVLAAAALAIVVLVLAYVALTSACLDPEESAGPDFAFGKVMFVWLVPLVAAWITALIIVLGRGLQGIVKLRRHSRSED